MTHPRTQDLGLAVLDPATEPLQVPPTRPIRLATRPMPLVVLPRLYPPPVPRPGLTEAVTTLLPQVRPA